MERRLRQEDNKGWKEETQRAEAAEAKIVHCENCGGDYAATGLDSGCPCKLLAVVEAAKGGMPYFATVGHSARHSAAWVENMRGCDEWSTKLSTAIRRLSTLEGE
jgi:hypothetical protein